MPTDVELSAASSGARLFVKVRLRSCSLAARYLWQALHSKSVMGPCCRFELRPLQLARIMGAEVEEVVAAAANLIDAGLVRGKVTPEQVALDWFHAPEPSDPSPDVAPTADTAVSGVAQGASDAGHAQEPPPPADPEGGDGDDGNDDEDPTPRPRPRGRGRRGTGRGESDHAPKHRGAPQKKTKNNKNKKKRSSSCSSPSSPSSRDSGAHDAASAGAFAGAARKGPHWTPSAGWQGLDEENLRRWSDAYPGVSIQTQLLRMDSWLHANPGKSQRPNWAHFIVNWLKREADRTPPVAPPVGTAMSTRPTTRQAPLLAGARRAAERAGEFPEPSLLAGIVITGPTGHGTTNTNNEGARNDEAAAA